MGKRYSRDGADELVYLDISATIEGRHTFLKLVSSVARNINIPFTVGGGINSLEDATALLSSGADKISINSAAVANPGLITEIADKYGSQFIVVAIDARISDGRWKVVTHSGNRTTDLELFSWAREAERLGAGEIMFTSMDHDGTKNGYACQELKHLSNILSIPLIASGGAGSIEHFTELFKGECADAALASSIFHFNEVSIQKLKNELKTNNIEVRL